MIDILIIVVIILLVVAAGYSLHKNKKKCGGYTNCSCCSMNGSCNKKKKDK